MVTFVLKKNENRMHMISGGQLIQCNYFIIIVANTNKTYTAKLLYHQSPTRHSHYTVQ